MAEGDSTTDTNANAAVFTMWGLVGAIVLVAATTVDDAIWLIPYTCSPSLSWHIRVQHMLTFVATLVCLAVLCCIVAYSFAAFIIVKDDHHEYTDVLLGAIGALLCWIIAITLYVKKLCKKRNRQRQQQEQQQEQQQQQQQRPCSKDQSQGDYGTIAGTAEDDLEAEALVVANGIHNHDNDNDDETSSPPPRTRFDPWTVMRMTFLGALDEISYFPALIMGHVFTSSELVLGTALAACLICLVISTTFLLAPCRPIMAWLDTIPLYAIVGVFAVVLTIGVFVDLLPDDKMTTNDNDGQQ